MGLEKYKISKKNQEESLTFYNEQNQPIGIVNREEGINRGLLLEGVQLWIINPDTNQVLMQRRSKNKKNNPNKIDVSVSAHVDPDETATQAMLREAGEEIGLTDSAYLYSKMQKIAENKINLADYGRQGRYIMHFYLAFLNNPLESYKKQDSEVDELFFMDYEEVKRRIRNNDQEMLMPKSDEAEMIFSILDEKIKTKYSRIKEEKEKI